MPQTYMECKHSARIPSNFCKPEMEQQLLGLIPKAQEFRELLSAYKNMPLRAQTVGVRLMLLHTEFVEKLAAIMAIKCLGKDEQAKAAAQEFFRDFGKHEIAWDRYYDQKQMVQALTSIFNAKSQVDM